MTHETAPLGQNAASGGCCGGMAKEKAAAAAAAVVKPDAKPAADAKHADHTKAGGSCC